MGEENVNSNDNGVIDDDLINSSDGVRPTFLTILCVLSFIGSGLGVLFGLLLTFGMGAILAAIPGIESSLGGGTIFFAIGTILSGASLYSVIQMWNMKKMGFFIYIAASAIGIVVPLVFGLPFSVFGTFITILFVVFYYLNFKYMK